MNLEDYNTEELLAEIKKREKGEEVGFPKEITHDFTKLIENVKDYMKYVASDEYHEDNDWNHYIFEVAIESIYGKGVWEWISSNVK